VSQPQSSRLCSFEDVDVDEDDEGGCCTIGSFIDTCLDRGGQYAAGDRLLLLAQLYTSWSLLDGKDKVPYRRCT